MPRSVTIPTIPDWQPLYPEDAPDILLRVSDLPIILLRVLWSREPNTCYHRRLLTAAAFHFGVHGQEPFQTACSGTCEPDELRSILRQHQVREDPDCFWDAPGLWAAFSSAAVLPRCWDNLLEGSPFYRDRRSNRREAHPVADRGRQATAQIFDHAANSIELLKQLAPMLLYAWGMGPQVARAPEPVSLATLLPNDPTITEANGP
ncbi:MAG: hypothetical protein EA401_00655 [Planctomycetota bacterium]|nr:MAG: hypothetical protein EA401_00655 [Planctomycetota bacterium]